MPKEKQLRPRLIHILTVLLILQSPILIFLGINLLTKQWSFLASWPRFWSEFRMAFELVLQTPGEHTSNEVLLYDVLIFTVLEVSAAVSLLAGLAFYRGRAISWMLGLVAQIGTLSAGLVLFFFEPNTPGILAAAAGHYHGDVLELWRRQTVVLTTR